MVKTMVVKLGMLWVDYLGLQSGNCWAVLMVIRMAD